MLSWPVKDPADRLDYMLDWGTKRLVPGDEIVNSVWFTNSEGSPGLVIDTDSFDALSTKVWLTGGMVGTTYITTNRVTTTAGRIMEFSVKLKVKER